MLYVFYVDIGSMLKFEMNLAMQSVHKLHEAIFKKCQIPIDKQVLLVSGGENVDSANKVCSYFAGTDTNPFFLFNKDALSNVLPPFEMPVDSSDKVLEDKLKDLLNKPATFEVVMHRTQLAQTLSESAQQKRIKCMELVHSQHLQHQGWSAVIANMLDITSAFQNRSKSFIEKLSEYLEHYDEYVNLIDNFPQTIALLNKIPAFPCLPFNAVSSTSQSVTSSSSSLSLPLSTPINSLLDWIVSQESRCSLEQIIEQCRIGLSQFNRTMLDLQLKEADRMIEAVLVDRKEMKTIRGLEDRLSGLEKLMVNIKKIAKEQEELAKIFCNFNLRVRALQDSSMLPDLCGSHKQYLEIMLSNHHILIDGVYKCHKTKYELCENLNNRLRWVMLTEQSLCELDNRLLIRGETLKKLKKKLQLVQQIVQCPTLFCKAISEVFRRKKFAKNFHFQASRTSSSFSELHDMEVMRRKDFEEHVPIKDHFLKVLFPGLEEDPPIFATKCPEECDKMLPDVASNDMINLSNCLPPQLTAYLDVDSSSTTSSDIFTSTFMTMDVACTSNITSTTIATTLIKQISSQSTNSTPTNAMLVQQTQTDINTTNFAEFIDNRFHNESPLSRSYELIHRRTSSGKHTQSSDDRPSANVITTSSQSLTGTSKQLLATQRLLPADVKGAEHANKKETSTTCSSIESPALTTTTSAPTMIPACTNKSHQQTQQQQHSPVGASPEFEDAHNDTFSTADFYFDESMHSSATTDPASSKKIMELQLLLQERILQLESKDKEVIKLKEKLDNLNKTLSFTIENYSKLVAFCNSCVSESKVFLEDIRCDHESFIYLIKDEMTGYDASFKKFYDDVQCIIDEKDELLKISDLQMQEANNKIELLEKQINLLKETVDDNEKQIQDELQKEMLKSKELFEDEMTAKMNQLILENEVELDKMKSDCKNDLKLKEDAVCELEFRIKSLEESLGRSIKEKEESVSSMQSTFNKMKCDLVEKMNNEFMEKQSSREMELRSDLKDEYEQIFQGKMLQLENQHRNTMNTFNEHVKNLSGELNSLSYEVMVNEYCDSIKSDSTEVLSSAVLHSGGDNKNSHAGCLIDYNIPELFAKISKVLKTVRENHMAARVSFCRIKKLLDDKKVKVKEVSTSTEDDNMSGALLQCSNLKCQNMIKKAEHETILRDKINQLNDDHCNLMRLLEEDLCRKHKETMESMNLQRQQERQELRARVLTEAEEGRQISFNLALKQAMKDRDDHIQQLELRINELQDKLKKCEKVPSEELTCNIHKTSDQNVEVELVGSQKKLQGFEQQLSGTKPSDVVVNQPTTNQPVAGPLLIMNRLSMDQSVMSQSVDQATFERIFKLEDTLRNREEENKKLKDKLITLKMSKSSRNVFQNSVNVTSCYEGSITLFVLDQQSGHYIAYLASSNHKHFLHVDSLETLGLTNTQDASTSSSSTFLSPLTSSAPTWIVAEVTSKELCQAKKTNNRFMLPVGTRFYRVKAKPWSPDKFMKRSVQKCL